MQNITKTQTDSIIDRAYSAIAEGSLDKHQLDQLLIDMEMYIQQQELVQIAINITQSPKDN
jgi:hypothetical protein